jgi:hypothetical protein
MLITPWAWSIAYRRFQQGILIRFGYSREVGMGTVVRLTVGGGVLVVGYWMGTLPGVAVGAIAQALGVLSEAVFAGWRVQRVIKRELKLAPLTEELSWRSFARFYTPLAMTSLIGLLWQPLGSAALSRMPEPLTSLAVWPVASGLVNIFRSFGYAVNEVVVSLLDKKGSYRNILRFVLILASTVTGLQLLVLLTPAAMIWFSGLSALSPKLASLAMNSFWLALPMAGLTVFQSWFQGTIVTSRKTRAIPEATGMFLGVFLIIAMIGINSAQLTGIYVGMVGFVIANLAQSGWLWLRSRDMMREVKRRDGV